MVHQVAVGVHPIAGGVDINHDRQQGMLLQSREVFENLQPGPLTFFRVKLGREQISTSDHGDKLGAVRGTGSDDRIICRCDIVTVDEIEVSIRPDSFQERRRRDDVEPIPSHVRNLQARLILEADNVAGNHAE